MGDKQPAEKSENLPIYEELASELTDPAETAWEFPPTPSFVSELVAAVEEGEEATAAAS